MSKQNELKGTRHKVAYRNDQKLYVSVFQTEVFVSSALDNQDDLTASGLDAITRLLSLCLQNNLKEDAIKQLSKASRGSRDFPGILVRLLRHNS